MARRPAAFGEVVDLRPLGSRLAATRLSIDTLVGCRSAEY
jgi:hypothetical protein